MGDLNTKKVYIIHGWTYSTDGWKECIYGLREKGIDVVTLNVPGLTKSSDEVWTLDKYVEWLSEKLQNEEKVVLIGHSNGGRISISFSEKYPEKVSKLILIDSAGIVHNELPLRIKRKLFGALAKAGKVFKKVPFLRKVFYKLIGARDYGRANPNMRETMKNLISVDLTPSLKKLNLPTLIIWGKKDEMTPLSDAYVMNKEISGSKLVLIEEAKHSPHKTHPKEVSEEISSWLAKNDAL